MPIRKRIFSRFSRFFFSFLLVVVLLENAILLTRVHHNMMVSSTGIISSANTSTRPKNCSGNFCESFANSQNEHGNNTHLTNSSSNVSPWIFPSYPENDEERKFYKLSKTVIAPYRYDFLINGSNICDENTTVVILVHSILSNIDKRNGIRSTWGSVSKGSHWPGERPINANVKLAFVFGQQANWTEKLLKENEREGGIIQGNFTDTYRNLTLKSLLGFKWVIDFCPNVAYVIKSDDDMFINLPYLLNILAFREPFRRTIVGPLSLGSRVLRQGKWKLTKDVYPFKTLPPYESGASYVLTADIIGELFEAAKYVPQIFIDDVYITGILGRTLGINHARQYGFAFFNSKLPSVCDILLDRIITAHRLSGAKLRNFWAEMHRTKMENCKKISNEKKSSSTLGDQQRQRPNNTGIAL